MRLVIVTGLSGAGRTMALRQLEDMSYFCVDNLPPQMIGTFIRMCHEEQNINKAAVVVDTRAGTFFEHIYEAVSEIANDANTDLDILFMETSDEVLIRRYKESRRNHPMDAMNIAEGISKERKMLAQLKETATHVVDTTALSARQLGDLLWGIFAKDSRRAEILPIVVSFGFKNGIPLDADLVFDVRFLPNPFYNENLKRLNGLQSSVRDFVFSYPQTVEFMDKLMDMITFLMPHYRAEGKYQVVIAIGCTGGMHRSVAVAQELYRRLSDQDKRAVIQHRDIKKDLQIER